MKVVFRAGDRVRIDFQVPGGWITGMEGELVAVEGAVAAVMTRRRPGRRAASLAGAGDDMKVVFP